MRKKLIVVAIGLLAFILPITVFAQDFRGDSNRLFIGSGETIDHNLYVASGEVAIDGTVNGDLFVGGGQTTVRGIVNQDLFIGGGQVYINGKINGDVRVGGGNVTVNGTIGGELMVFAGSLNIERDAVISGDVAIGAGQATISGTTGPILASTGTLALTSTAKVNGNLTYTSSEPAQIANGATISGSVNHKIPKDQAEKGVIAYVTGKLLGLFIGLIIALLFLYLLPNKARVLANDWKDRFGLNLLWGLIILILIPIVAIILLISIIGIPVGIGLLLLYPIYLYLGHIVSFIALGAWIKNLWEKEKNPAPTWLAVLIGAIALTILSFIPVIGWLAAFIIFLTGLGVLVKFDWNLLVELKNRKTL